MAEPLSRGIKALVLVAALSPGAAETAFAQSQSRVEMSVSYQGVPDASLTQLGMRPAGQGWNLDAAIRLTPMISLVGGIDGSYSEDNQPTTAFGGGRLYRSWRDIGYLGGVRWYAPLPSRIALFAQAAGGVLDSRRTVEYQTARPFRLSDYTGASPVPIVSLGGGVNVMITRRFGARVGGDVRVDVVGKAFEADDATMARVYAGVVFRIP